MSAPSASAAAVRPRLARIDALRGLAVFGILFVNVWSHVWGFQPLRYGVLPPDATLADMLSLALTALLAEQKFYPVFAFLFGASAVLITRAIRRRSGRWDEARRLYRRRLLWLLACGVLHGTLIWFGDILTLYGLLGCVVLLGTVGVRARTLLLHLRLWLLAFFALLGVGLWLSLQPLSGDEQAALALAAVDGVEASRKILTQGDWLAIAQLRLQDYLTMTAQSLLIVPQVAVLFLLGAWSVRRGWLTRPWRHRTLWRRTFWIGLTVGLPFNLAWATMRLLEAIDPLHPWPWTYTLFALLPLGGMLLAASYVALFMLADGGPMHAVQGWLAPVGRMALTNYLLQSLLCTVLLQGFGFGLGATLPPTGWMALAGAIVVAQSLWSRWWLARHASGPIEGWQRRWLANSP